MRIWKAVYHFECAYEEDHVIGDSMRCMFPAALPSDDDLTRAVNRKQERGSGTQETSTTYRVGGSSSRKCSGCVLV